MTARLGRMILRAGLALMLALVFLAEASAPPGGLSDEKPVDDDVREVVASIEDRLKTKYPGELIKLEPISYRRASMVGFSYLVRAVVTEADGRNRHIHLKFWQHYTGRIKYLYFNLNVDEKSPLGGQRGEWTTGWHDKSDKGASSGHERVLVATCS